jgi:hypothetical protein
MASKSPAQKVVDEEKLVLTFKQYVCLQRSATKAKSSMEIGTNMVDLVVGTTKEHFTSTKSAYATKSRTSRRCSKEHLRRSN